MDAIQRLLSSVTLPKMVRIRQSFDDTLMTDVAAGTRKALQNCPAYHAITPGAKLAVTVGSRGIASLGVIVRAIVDALKERGAKPFIVPAMGSHGGATAEGQLALVNALGVTEKNAGCPILSSMEVVQVAQLPDGFPVYMDKYAFEADGVVIFNRIKPHNAFRARHESGILKMLAIGLGKHHGAESTHTLGFGHMGRLIEEVGTALLTTGKVTLGIGSIENAYDKVKEIVVCGADDFITADREGLKRATANMPRLLFNKMDLLICDSIGKEYSGGGMDGNIIGRYSTPFITGGPDITRIVALGLSPKSHGNANGIGLADVIPDSMVKDVDLFQVYTNVITSGATPSARMPMHLATEELAIKAGLKTGYAADASQALVMRIPNTLHLGEVFISESMLSLANKTQGVTILSDPQPMSFNASGKLIDKY